MKFRENSEWILAVKVYVQIVEFITKKCGPKVSPPPPPPPPINKYK